MAKSNALKFGILGAFTGLLDAKISDWKTRLAEEAEIRKQERLEQLKIAAEVRAEERGNREFERNKEWWVDQQDTLAAISKDTDERRAQQAMDLARSQHTWRLDELHDQQAATASENAANRAAQIEIANARQPDNEYADIVMIENPQTGEQKFDSLTTLRQQGIPVGWRLGTTRGVTSAMPSASKSGAPATTPRPGVGRPAAPRSYNGFSATQN